MFSRHLYFGILLHVIFILLTASLGVYLIVSGLAFIFGSLLCICTLFQISCLIAYLNAQNRKIAFFLNAIEDNESTFYFPEQNVGADQRLLYESFNRINDLIGQMKMKGGEQEHFYKALLENIPGGVIAWDDAGNILTVNNTALKLLECNYLSDRSQLNRLSPDFAKLPDASLPIIKIFTSRGMRQLAVNCTFMRLRERSVTLLSVQDINEALNEKETDSWNKLTHILTHEIMNSIAPITSLSEMLSDYFEKDGTNRKQEDITEDTIQKTIKGLNIIQRRGNNLLRFTEAYRKLTGLPEPEIHLFPFKEMTENLYTLLSSDLEKNGVRLSVNIIPDTLVVRADENQLSQVMINLLQNAMQALTQLMDREKRIRLEAGITDAQVVIKVIDNGPGISPEVLENIFVPFFTTKTTGSGIGLSLCRQIIHLHKGQLQVASILGEETCFTILLPA